MQLATPNSDGVYEFEIELAYTFTMYSPSNNTPVMYDVNSQRWIRINSTLDSLCNSSNVISDNLDFALQDINQFSGLHIRMISINGKIPGDPIVVPLGAEVVMRIKNRLNTHSLSIHVHGLDKNGLWYTDGAAFIQQCPICPNSDYSYRFIADTAGTLFYHGHLGTEFGEGIIGGFVVTKPNQTTYDTSNNLITVGREYYVLLQDIGILGIEDQWQVAINQFDKYAKQLNDPWNLSNSSSCWSHARIYDGTPLAVLAPVSALLIGSKGWYNQNDLKTTPSRLPLSTYLIKKGENVRFRYVNAGIGHVIMIWLENHSLTIVTADGVDVKPVKVDALVIFPGERYDILIQGLATPKQKNYRFIFETLERYDYSFQPIDKTIGLSNLQYEDPTLQDTDIVDLGHRACTQTNKCVVLNCPFGQFASTYNYTCLNVGSLQNADPVYVDNEIIQQKVFTSGYEEYFINVDHDEGINGNLFEMPQGMPYFYYGNENQILTPCNSTLCNLQNDQCRCFTNFNFTLGNIVQLTLYMSKDANLAAGGKSHPFHMHGTHFYVMKVIYPSSSGYTSNGLLSSPNNDIPCTTNTCYGLKWGNSSWLNGNVDGMYKNPSARDNIVLPIGGYVVIRFRADNPGWWFAHCHFLIHHLKGMAFAFRIGEHNQMPVPPQGFPHACGIYEQGPLNLPPPTGGPGGYSLPPPTGRPGGSPPPCPPPAPGCPGGPMGNIPPYGCPPPCPGPSPSPCRPPPPGCPGGPQGRPPSQGCPPPQRGC
uniref:L-ascorbate oxidase n=1 Tax=Acrobeloides nanus TaxID=290746 RepID=A0A914C8N0_9BILA